MGNNNTNTINEQKVEEIVLNQQFEIENGLLGAKRDILMRLIELMIFNKDSLVQNLIGISGESVCWINHFHFVVARTSYESHLERHIIPSKRKRGKEITIKFKNIIFNVGDSVSRSILIKTPIKKTILECTIKINKNTNSYFYVGICTPEQVNNVVVKWLGNDYCGGSFGFHSCKSWVFCFGKYSPYFKEGEIKDGKEEEITAVVNDKNVVKKKEKQKQGKMNIIKNQKRVPHTIVNIPTKDGVHLGFSFCGGSITLSFISLHHVSVLPPPFNDGMRCIAYDFLGGFEDYSLNQKDEEGKEVPNIMREYYRDGQTCISWFRK